MALKVSSQLSKYIWKHIYLSIVKWDEEKENKKYRNNSILYDEIVKYIRLSLWYLCF